MLHGLHYMVPATLVLILSKAPSRKDRYDLAIAIVAFSTSQHFVISTCVLHIRLKSLANRRTIGYNETSSNPQIYTQVTHVLSC